MKKKLGKYFLISFLLLFFPLLSYPQTIIKEKVRVSPKQTLSKIPNEVQDESQLEFQIGGALPLTTTVVGPTSTQSGSGSGGANPYVYLYFAPLNGDYQITISSTLSAGQNTNVNYAVSYQVQGISSGERWLYNGSEETAVISTTINITITTLPEETPVDFGFEFNRYYICARDESGLVITYYNKEVTPTTNVKFGIISSVAGVELYNKNTGEVITNETTVHINDIPNLSIRLSVPYQGSNANAKVTAEISGVTREDSLKIIGSGDYFRLYSVKRIWDMLEGGTIEMTVEMRGESDCDDVRLQDSTKYNLTMTQGETFGHIKHPVTGELVTTANNLPHENGKLKFKFTADGELPTSEEWAYVRVTTTNPDISPYDFIIKIHKEGMTVTFVPEAIMPGDTASIILKKKNADGTLSDFPEDQYYDAEIIDGAEYGTLYVPQWGDLSDYLLDIPPGFKFIAEEGITEPRAASTILVRTTAGIIWGRVTPGKINQQNSVQNTTEEEQLWGEGTITIGSGGDCSDAPQCEGETTPLQFVTKENPNGSFGINVCPLYGEDRSTNGITAPIPKTMQQHLGDVIVPCYNSVADRWQFNLGILTFDLILDLCVDNIEYNKSKFGFRYVNSIDEIPENDICGAIDDLEDFKQYAKPLRHGAYIFYELLWTHERAHKADYEKCYQPAFEEMNKRLKEEYAPKCSEISDINEVKERARFMLGTIFEEEYKKAEDEQKKKSSDSDWEQEIIHNKIIPNINDLIHQLNLKHGC